MKFSHKLIAAATSILLLTVSALSISQYKSTESEIERNIETNLDEILSSVSANIIFQLASLQDMAVLTQQQIELAPTDKERVQRVISTPRLLELFRGVAVGYEADGSFVNNQGWVAPSDFEVRDRDWYQNTKNAKSYLLTEPYLDSNSSQIIVSATTPIRSQRGDFLAAMSLDVSLNSVTEMIKGINLFDAGSVFITSQDGTIIAHQEEKYIGKPYQKFLGNIERQDKPQFTHVNNIEYEVHFIKVPNYDWYVGAYINVDVAFASLETIKWQAIMLGSGGLIISILLLGLLMRRLLAPLTALNQAIEDVASGDGDLTHRLNEDSDFEFRLVAQNFNRFMDKLHKQVSESKLIADRILALTHSTTTNTRDMEASVASQLAQLEQLATAMNEMASTAHDVANNAQGAATAAQQADKSALEASPL